MESSLPRNAEAPRRDLLVEPRFFRLRKARPHEHPSTRATKRFWIDARIQYRLVGRFDEQTTLRVHSVRLLEVHTEERCVELVQIVDFAHAPGNLDIEMAPADLLLVDHIHLYKAIKRSSIF